MQQIPKDCNIQLIDFKIKKHYLVIKKICQKWL